MEEKNLLSIIEKGENKKVEFKSTLRWDLRKGCIEKIISHSVLKTIAAFLNSEGGILFIGVDDDGKIIGLESDFLSFKGNNKEDEFQKTFDTLIQNHFGNHINRNFNLSFIKQDDKTIAVINVTEKASGAIFLKYENNEQFYIRRNSSTVELKGSEMTIYIKEHWKYQTSPLEKVIESETPDFKTQLAQFLIKIQNKTVPLSIVLAEILNFCNKNNLQELKEFCKNELVGWENVEIESKPENETKFGYRLIDCYLGIEKINPQYLGWNNNASNVFQYIQNNPNKFFPIKMFCEESITNLESKPVPSQASLTTYTLKASKFLKKVKPGDTLPAYADSNCYHKVIDQIRTELTKKIISLI